MSLDLNTLTTPSLLLDKEKAMGNLSRMVRKASRSGVEFRPHCKTHQSLAIAEWLREFGVRKITTSSVTMAHYFSREWDDITIAFPVNIREIKSINELSGRIRLQLLAESKEALVALEDGLNSRVGVYIKIDVGTHRTGLEIPAELDAIDGMIDFFRTAKKLDFLGFLSHAGHTYNCRSREAIEAVHRQNIKTLHDLRTRYQSDFSGLKLSTGDTPACSLIDDLSDVDEIRPGNFIFYDLAQWQIGSCRLEDIACALACPVVAKHPSRNEIVLYGGGIHFSKDSLELDGETVYGREVIWDPEGKWQIPADPSWIRSLSQEHGIVKANADAMERYGVGDLMFFLPVHSCMAADLMKQYTTLDGLALTMMNAPKQDVATG